MPGTHQPLTTPPCQATKSMLDPMSAFSLCSLLFQPWPRLCRILHSKPQGLRSDLHESTSKLPAGGLNLAESLSPPFPEGLLAPAQRRESPSTSWGPSMLSCFSPPFPRAPLCSPRGCGLIVCSAKARVFQAIPQPQLTAEGVYAVSLSPREGKLGCRRHCFSKRCVCKETEEKRDRA